MNQEEYDSKEGTENQAKAAGLKSGSKLWKELQEWMISLAVAFVVALLIHNYAVAQTEVEMNSMENTLYEGQRLIEDKITYRFTDPDRGDIVIVHGPEYEQRLVKRVIGLPGDVLDIKGGNVYINGELLEEEYTKGETFPNGLAVPYTVPQDHYFVMGDNREISLDSRQLGPIQASSIEGRIVYRIWPLSEFGYVQ